MADNMSRQLLECRPLTPELLDPLVRLFDRIVQSGVDRYFHPHPFTRDEALRRVNYRGRDVYLALVWDGEVVGYGMLRGWDEGFAIPSLGIVVDSAMQGRGYGRLLMSFLHATAKERGAEKVRLKVYANNSMAVSLYKSLGYVFTGEEESQLIGFLNLETD